jgi:predicted signal transduction protein with EAL and GGDEF domain
LRLTIAGISASDSAGIEPEASSGFKASASFGITSTVSSGYDLRQLLAHADAALYTAKRGGRNRVAVYETSVAALVETGTPEVSEFSESAPDITAAKILGIASN